MEFSEDFGKLDFDIKAILCIISSNRKYIDLFGTAQKFLKLNREVWMYDYAIQTGGMNQGENVVLVINQNLPKIDRVSLKNDLLENFGMVRDGFGLEAEVGFGIFVGFLTDRRDFDVYKIDEICLV